MMSRNPDLKWEEIARGIGRCLLQKIQEAEKSQYESIVSSPSPSVSAAPSERDSESLVRMARWTPLRLVWAERELLRLLEAALYISDYTDNVDTYNFYNQKHMIRQIRHICSVLTGLVVARNYEQGQRLIKDKEFKDLSGFFQACFEIGRRYKILNPERMRDSYGKLLYFLMDSRIPSVAKMLEFDCVAPVKTVWQLLEKKFKGLDLLNDPLLIKATKGKMISFLAEMVGRNIFRRTDPLASEISDGGERKCDETIDQKIRSFGGKTREAAPHFVQPIMVKHDDQW